MRGVPEPKAFNMNTCNYGVTQILRPERDTHFFSHLFLEWDETIPSYKYTPASAYSAPSFRLICLYCLYN